MSTFIRLEPVAIDDSERGLCVLLLRRDRVLQATAQPSDDGEAVLSLVMTDGTIYRLRFENGYSLNLALRTLEAA
jgi:hypothetical protein